MPRKSTSSAVERAAGFGMPNHLVRPLALRSMFMRPQYLEPSAWIEHIPFAFWLIEAQQPKVVVELGTHHGTSYFAFCQAVERLGLDAQCFAVDTWKGDEHSGFYGEDVYEKVVGYNSAQYSAFSSLIRSSFDAAAEHFSSRSIDLLHVDGLHTLEAVKHDFQTWLPKLSERAIVVLHDSNVRERNFGVFKLIEEVRETYPAFEFVHGHGLAVLGVGAEQNELLQQLFNARGDEQHNRIIQEVFGRMGRACADAFAAKESQVHVRKFESAVTKYKKELEEVKSVLQRTEQNRNNQMKELIEARSRVQTQAEQHAAEKTLAETQAKLREVVLQADLERRAHAAEQAAEASLRDMRDRLAQTDSALAQRRHEAEQTAAELKAAREELRQEAAARAEAEASLRDMRDRLAQTDSALAQRRHEAEQTAAELKAAREELRQEAAARAEAEKIAGGLKEHVVLLMADVKERQSASREAEEKAEVERELKQEIATLTRLLDEKADEVRRQELQVDCIQRSAAKELGRAVATLLGRSRWPQILGRLRLKRQIGQLKQSGLLDAEWYLHQYPDVAKAGLDPLCHYAEFGAREGRQPNPRLGSANGMLNQVGNE